MGASTRSFTGWIGPLGLHGSPLSDLPGVFTVVISMARQVLFIPPLDRDRRMFQRTYRDQRFTALMSRLVDPPARLLHAPRGIRPDTFADGGEGGIRTPDRLAPMPHFECGAFNHSATSPGAKTGRIGPAVGPCSRRGSRGRQGARRRNSPKAAPAAVGKEVGPPDATKNWRSRAAALKSWPGSAASPVSRSDEMTVATAAETAT